MSNSRGAKLKYATMLSKVFVSDQYIRNTKCTKCTNYLSVPPIIIESNNPVCGRCVTQSVDIEENRAYFFEDLAKFMFFPCINDIFGCPVQSPWGKVIDHEGSCEYNRITCPAIGCENRIGREDITHHFELKHQHLILKRNQCYLSEFIAEDSSCVNRLWIWNKHLFIIQTMESDNGNLFFRLSNFKDSTSKTLNITLKSKLTSSSICLDKFKVMTYKSKFHLFSHTEMIDYGLLRNVLGSEITCLFRFDDELKPNNCETDNNKLFSEVECPICADYMRPPIFMCPTGHSLCEHCEAKLSKCPLCSRQFGGTRNYSLERITEIITYPCRYKNQGCDFAENINNIVHHEATCSRSLQDEMNCLVDDITCKWKGQYNEVYQHISSSHHKFCILLGHKLLINTDASKTTQGYFVYDKKVFKLYIDCNKNIKNGLRWAISCIKNKVVCLEKYMFYLEFRDNNRILTISDTCHRIPATIVNTKCVHFVTIPFFLIQPFIKGNKIAFTLNIVKL